MDINLAYKVTIQFHQRSLTSAQGTSSRVSGVTLARFQSKTVIAVALSEEHPGPLFLYFQGFCGCPCVLCIHPAVMEPPVIMVSE